ncbi:hypothetical protein [Neobacillus sp. NPDC093127]|uniref:hypothetical protein n=1 Tax=Neobacillus sp. NPDC093127 TaxID=3364296 RepID=UPI0037F43DDB
MSNPNIGNITPLISITTAQTVPLLLASVALEELALAHLVNAEAEKLQLVLGTLTPTRTTLSPAVVSLTNLLAIDASVQRTLRDVIKKEMLLEFKFENVLDLIASTSGGDLTITKSGPALVVPGGFTQYNITVTNTGTVPLTNLTVTDAIPPGTVFTSASPPPGFTASFSGGVVTFTATSPFAPGSSALLQFAVSAPVTAGTVFTNTATASANEIAPVTSNTVITVT